MRTRLYSALKKWALLIVSLYALALTITSFMNLNDVPSIGISNEDKVFHAFAYFLFALLLYNFLKKIQMNGVIINSVVAVTTYGIIIEVLQYVLTSHRSFDFYDALANFTGAMVAAVLLKIRDNRKLNLN